MYLHVVVVGSHALVAHDLAVEVVDLLVQLGDAGVVALALADLVVQVHAGQVELADQVLQVLVVVVCLAGLVQCQVTGVGLQGHCSAPMVLPLDNGTTQVQVVSWYDNENSYTSQMVRTIKYFAELA